MNKLIISLVTWNSEKFLKDCLESIIRQTYKDFNLFIFDNYSTDNTISIVNDFLDPRFNLIKNDKNIGYCGGHNHVINATDSEYVLLLNPDIIMDDHYIELALKKMDTNDKIGTLCGLLLQSKTKRIIDSAGMSFTKDMRYILRFHGKDANKTILNETFVDGADGALPLYRRSMINDIKINGNFFDEMFFAHKEDWDISWRSKLFGWKTLFTPECIAVHPRGFKPSNLELRNKLADDVKFHAVKNQFILILKNAKGKELILNFIPLLTRQLGIFFYLLLKERKSLSAYNFICKNLKTIINHRNLIKIKLATSNINSKEVYEKK